ncbi:MAG: hypothetical protein Q8M03_14835 [Legionella sp.]|nr:hypothetical protein [Legionella sp.]
MKKIIFTKIFHNGAPFTWDYDEKKNTATWTGSLANGKSVPYEQALSLFKNKQGITGNGNTFIISDAHSFFLENTHVPLIDAKTLQSPRSPRGFFPSSSPKRAAHSPSSHTADLGSSSEPSEAKKIIHPISFDALIPEDNAALASVWRSTGVYEKELTQKTEADSKQRQYNSIKSVREPITASSHTKTVATNPIKGEMVGVLRYIFNKLLAPIQSKLDNEIITSPLLSNYFRCYIQEVLKESYTDLCMKGMVQQRYEMGFLIGNDVSPTAVDFDFELECMQEVSIRLKLAPLIFLTHPTDITSEKLTKDVELKKHLELLRAHTQTITPLLQKSISELKTLLEQLNEKRLPFYVEEKKIVMNIQLHEPIEKFLSFYALLKDLIKHVSIAKVDPRESNNIRNDFFNETTREVISKIREQTCHTPRASGQVADLCEQDPDFYIVENLYIPISDALIPFISQKPVQTPKTLRKLVPQIGAAVISVINSYLDTLEVSIEDQHSSLTKSL